MRAETRPANPMLPMLFMLRMLDIAVKKTTSVDLHRPLLTDIAKKYSDLEAQDLEDDIHTLNERRSQLENPAKGGSFDAHLRVLVFYFRALCLIETLFSSAKGEINNLTFTWSDAFKPKKKASQQNIHLEKAAILFNLGAVYSQIGKTMDRSTEATRKQVAKAFRLAAGAFAYLGHNAAAEASMGRSTTVDVSVECAAMLEKLMLAQAQECCFEIAVGGQNSPGACAMISRQVALDYEEALAALNAAPLKGHVFQDWKSYMQLKAALFNAVACYGHALKPHNGDEAEVAEQIAWLTKGISTLSEVKELTKGGPLLRLSVPIEIKKIVKAIEELKANMSSSLSMAERDIGYPRSVPSLDSLPSIPPCSIVKQPIPINEVLGVSDEKLFASLVGHSSVEALSRYAELVGDIIRIHEKKLQQCSELISRRLKEMDLPYFILDLEGHLTLPPDLKQDVEAVQISGGSAGLEAELLHLRRVNQELLLQTEELLQTRPQLNGIIDELKQAEKNDAYIEGLVNRNLALMSILDHQPIESALPNTSLDENGDAIVKEQKKSLGKLESLGVEGEQLQQDLERMKMEDDILPKLLATMGPHEDLVQMELTKYNPTREHIAQNIEKRKHLLSEIQAKNDELLSFPKLEDYKASRQDLNKQIQAAMAKYREVKEKISQAKNFYSTLRGIREQAEVPPAARVPSGVLATNPPAQPAQPSQTCNWAVAASHFTPEEREAMERLEAVRCDRESIREAYLACGKNEELAANYLLDHDHGSED